MWQSAKRGAIDEIPADVRFRCYKTIRNIEKDYMEPCELEREIIVYWGEPGTGKSRRAWAEAGMDAFPKIPTSIYWDGYQGHEHVVMDEFRGGIRVEHILRWFDRYPVSVECKFGAVVLKAKKIWITSNLDPRRWYPDLDASTHGALMRRLKITHFN